jgi:uncharacterized protein
MADTQPATETETKGTTKPKTSQSKIAKRWRAWLRAAHRDFGYLAVGFTIIYAVSGIAVNHTGDWDPKFVTSESVRKIAPITADVADDEAFARVEKELGFGKPSETYRAGDEIRLKFDHREVTIIGDSGDVTIQGNKPRFFFNLVVWLHTARSKPAWKYVADVYALMLLYLALSGLFMIKGRLGLKWRGSILVATGIAVPALYVILAGGPGQSAAKVEKADSGADLDDERGKPSPAKNAPVAPADDEGPPQRPPVRMPARPPG